MKDDDVVNEVKRALRDWALGDVKAAMGCGAKVGAFILSSCLIDYAASYYSEFQGKRETGRRYIDFVGRFMPSYDAKGLYQSLRNKLVHNYSEGGKYFMADGEKAGKHLAEIGGKTLLNLEDFVRDVEVALDEYLHALESDAEAALRTRCVARYTTDPPLQLVRVQRTVQGKVDLPPVSGSTTPVTFVLSSSSDNS